MEQNPRKSKWPIPASCFKKIREELGLFFLQKLHVYLLKRPEDSNISRHWSTYRMTKGVGGLPLGRGGRLAAAYTLTVTVSVPRADTGHSPQSAPAASWSPLIGYTSTYSPNIPKHVFWTNYKVSNTKYKNLAQYIGASHMNQYHPLIHQLN